MNQYYVNKNAQPTGEHEVHVEGCPTPPNIANRFPLGSHWSCKDAIAAAKRYYFNVDGCKHCIPACHTR